MNTQNNIQHLARQVCVWGRKVCKDLGDIRSSISLFWDSWITALLLGQRWVTKDGRTVNCRHIHGTSTDMQATVFNKASRGGPIFDTSGAIIITASV